jgi:hypothetical protein
MHFRLEQSLTADLETVQEAYVDRDLLACLADLPKLGGAELLDQHDDGTLVHQRVRYAFTGQLSSAVTAVVDPNKLTWVEDSTLDRRTHETTFRIVPDHYADRLECAGRFLLEAIDEATTRRILDADLRVRFPLVGGRVERAIVAGLADHARAEETVVNRWLAGLTPPATGATTDA